MTFPYFPGVDVVVGDLVLMVMVVVSTEYFFQILFKQACHSSKSISPNTLGLGRFENKPWPQHLLLIVWNPFIHSGNFAC